MKTTFRTIKKKRRKLTYKKKNPLFFHCCFYSDIVHANQEHFVS